MAQMLADEFERTTDELGRVGQLQTYRRSLGLPELSQCELCAHLAEATTAADPNFCIPCLVINKVDVVTPAIVAGACMLLLTVAGILALKRYGQCSPCVSKTRALD